MLLSTGERYSRLKVNFEKAYYEPEQDTRQIVSSSSFFCFFTKSALVCCWTDLQTPVYAVYKLQSDLDTVRALKNRLSVQLTALVIYSCKFGQARVRSPKEKGRTDDLVRPFVT